MIRPAVACLLILAGSTALAQPPAGGDDEAVRDVVRRYVEAREARDAKAVEALLTADADQLVSDGTWRRGRDALVRGMLESSSKNPGKRTIEVESVRLLGPDVALADGRYTLAGAGPDARAMWTTIILARADGGWKIAGIRNMLPAPGAK
ncbi:SgcJ/EcaC family oxidoreductase [Paludisphaera sp.]|uniref:YybH family protein n=1 Tax=Paludisphaera sp. TaxID=2017432 RepID=UPI00301D0C0A